MLPPAVVALISTHLAITGQPAHALDSSAAEALLWNELPCGSAGDLALLRDLNIITVTRQHHDWRIEVIANGLPLWRGGVQLAVDTTLSRPSMQDAARGAPA